MDTTARQLRPLDQRLLLLLVISLALVLGAAWWQLQHQPYRPRGPFVGPAVPWSAQLDAAQREALKVDKDALLYDVFALSNESSEEWAYTKTLRVAFTFNRASGHHIRILLVDADPGSTLEVETEDLDKPAICGLYCYNKAHIEAQIGTFTRVKLSPRQAVEVTWPEITSYSRQKGIPAGRVSVSLGLLTYEPVETGKPSDWHLLYSVIDPRIPTPTRDQLGTVVTGIGASFDVNAETGEITNRRFFDRRAPTPTPTHAP